MCRRGRSRIARQGCYSSIHYPFSHVILALQSQCRHYSRILGERHTMMQAIGTSHHALQAIWKAVRAIPRGQVSSYGTVARRAGFPGRARLVGYAPKMAPGDLPWHRVVAAGGLIAFPKTSRQFAEQRKRLRAEGVELTGGGGVRERAS